MIAAGMAASLSILGEQSAFSPALRSASRIPLLADCCSSPISLEPTSVRAAQLAL